MAQSAVWTDMPTGNSTMRGKRSASSPAISSLDQPVSPPNMMAAELYAKANGLDLNAMLSKLPAQYMLATSAADRLAHARLLQAHKQEGNGSVQLSFHADKPDQATVWLVFADRRGSLGVITSLLSELGANILKACVFSTVDGTAIDAFSVDRMDAGLADTLRHRLQAALCGLWSSDSVTDWAGLSLGAASSMTARSSSSTNSGVSNSLTNSLSESEPSPEFPPPISSAALSPLSLAAPPRRSPLPVLPAGTAPAADQAAVAPGALRSGLAASVSHADLAGWTKEEVNTLTQLQGQFANLSVRRLIDEGSSSQVWEGDWAGARVVIKVLREHEALRSFLSEVNIWKQLRHPCVCALLGVCTFDGRPSMVLEYMTGGSLHDLLHNTNAARQASAENGRRSRTNSEMAAAEAHEIDAMILRRVVAEVASGVAYLHSNGVMHRDVKSANVLLDDAQHAKVTDFGISTHFGRADYTAETGTYRQMAPEVILHKPYNYKCDVYSYGILMWEVLHQQVPFSRFAPLQAAFAVAMEGLRPEIGLREELAHYAPLIEACWDADPARRPDMDEVVRLTASALAARSSSAGSSSELHMDCD